MITSFILMTGMFDQVLILYGEIKFLSVFRLKGQSEGIGMGVHVMEVFVVMFPYKFVDEV